MTICKISALSLAASLLLTLPAAAQTTTPQTPNMPSASGTTAAPQACKPSAMAAPMPCDEPVTNAA